MKNNKLVLFALAIGIMFTSCNNDNDDIVEELPKGDYDNGILISHEGNFSGGFGTISYVSNDFTEQENNVFSKVNGRTLGTVVQSITFKDDMAYIIVNVSNQIEVVNRYTFESVATINTSVTNPRYMAISNGKGYVTAWGDYNDMTDDAVLVVDLSTNTVSETIATSYLPEEIISIDDKVFVATGIYGNGNKVDVIDTDTDELVESITVGNSPSSFQLDSNNDLWVLSSENLIEINASTNEVLQTLTFDDTISSPSNLNFEDGNFYFYAGGSVYKQAETAADIDATEILTGLAFYNMSVKDGMLYGVDAKDYASNGDLTVYDLSTNTLTQTITVNIIPGGIYFN